MLHACVQTFDVTEFLEVWRELNTATLEILLLDFAPNKLVY